MMSNTLAPAVDRHAAFGGRAMSASVLIVLALGLSLGAGAIGPGVAEPQVATVAASSPVADAVSRCGAPASPHDASLGNEGGDPYAFYVFHREPVQATPAVACLVTASAEGVDP